MFVVGTYVAEVPAVDTLKDAQAYPGNEFEHHELTGRPLGDEGFIEKAKRLLHRALKKKKPGPKGNGRIN